MADTHEVPPGAIIEDEADALGGKVTTVTIPGMGQYASTDPGLAEEAAEVKRLRPKGATVLMTVEGGTITGITVKATKL